MYYPTGWIITTIFVYATLLLCYKPVTEERITVIVNTKCHKSLVMLEDIDVHLNLFPSNLHDIVILVV